MKSLSLFVLVLVACSPDFELRNVWANDERVAKYVNQFFVEAEARGLAIPRENLIATVVNTPNSKPNPFEPGYWSHTSSGQNVILFDEFIFNSNSDSENEVMVFHELGHWKGLKHCDPCSDTLIMNSHVNFYMYDPKNSRASVNRRQLVLDQFFNLLR